jgi:hypothetical protein
MTMTETEKFMSNLPARESMEFDVVVGAGPVGRTS